jgi:hypothetical protein
MSAVFFYLNKSSSFIRHKVDGDKNYCVLGYIKTSYYVDRQVLVVCYIYDQQRSFYNITFSTVTKHDMTIMYRLFT